MDPEQLLRRMSDGQFENVAFSDAQHLVEALGFVLRKEHRGSHLVYRHPSAPTFVNLQPQRGQAKSYQMRQLLRLIQRFDLRLEEVVTEAPRDYHINIFYSEQDECYVADLPDFEYCSAFGDTPQEALAQLLIAKELWLEAAREDGIPPPTPRYRPTSLAPAPAVA